MTIDPTASSVGWTVLQLALFFAIHIVMMVMMVRRWWRRPMAMVLSAVHVVLRGRKTGRMGAVERVVYVLRPTGGGSMKIK